MTDLFTESPVRIVDRSTLERYATCPFAAWHYDHLSVLDFNFAAMSGTEFHRIVSEAIAIHVDTPMSRGEMAEWIKDQAGQVRPDLQPDVVIAAKAGAWTVAETICQHDDGQPRNADDIMRFDGGEGDRSGQIAMDWPRDGVIYRLTCELDLLLANPASDRVVDVRDWKSGWKWWTATAVRESFQFQFNTAVLWANLKKKGDPKWKLEEVTFRVVMPRSGDTTPQVTFREKDLYAIRQRIGTALDTYAKHADAKTPDEVPATPENARCEWCQCRMRCPLVKDSIIGLPDSDEELLKAYIATSAAADTMKARLTERVRKTGEEITVGNQTFGPKLPAKEPKARPCELRTKGDE